MIQRRMHGATGESLTVAQTAGATIRRRVASPTSAAGRKEVREQREFHYRWEYDLSASPQALWPLVADTNRFNRDAGLPDVADADDDGAHARNGRRRLRLSKLGVKVAWEEEPFEWIRPYRFGVVRRYRTGPVAEARVTAELSEREGGGTRLVYQIWARPRGPLGRAVIPVQVGRISRRKFKEVFRRYDEIASRGESQNGLASAARLGAGARSLLDSQRRKLLESGASPESVERLVETIENADELTLARLRPYALADAWGIARREALELCLKATRAGLLDLRWELLCPLCRGAKQSATTLRDVRADLHCDSCNIDFKGMVPVLMHAPPTTSRRSTKATRFPSFAPCMAARCPAGPEPMTIMS